MSFCHARSAPELVMFNLQWAPLALEVYSHERINVQAVTIFIHSLRHSLDSEQQRLGVVLPLHRREEGEKGKRKFFFYSFTPKCGRRSKTSSRGPNCSTLEVSVLRLRQP